MTGRQNSASECQECEITEGRAWDGKGAHVSLLLITDRASQHNRKWYTLSRIDSTSSDSL
jgi:hypothetical protein